eukprot:scaffold104246_cov35-Attheya_sp.AAC.1
MKDPGDRDQPERQKDGETGKERTMSKLTIRRDGTNETTLDTFFGHLFWILGRHRTHAMLYRPALDGQRTVPSYPRSSVDRFVLYLSYYCRRLATLLVPSSRISTDFERIY